LSCHIPHHKQRNTSSIMWCPISKGINYWIAFTWSTQMSMALSLNPNNARFESIDKVGIKVMKYAEKKCRWLAMGQVEYSPEISTARQLKILWYKIVHYKHGGKVDTAHIWWKGHWCGVSHPLSCSLHEAKWAKQLSIKHYEELKPKAAKLQKEFLWDIATNCAEKSNAKSCKHAEWLS
jgi:hypothetical protein